MRCAHFLRRAVRPFSRSRAAVRVSRARSLGSPSAAKALACDGPTQVQESADERKSAGRVEPLRPRRPRTTTAADLFSPLASTRTTGRTCNGCTQRRHWWRRRTSRVALGVDTRSPLWRPARPPLRRARELPVHLSVRPLALPDPSQDARPAPRTNADPPSLPSPPRTDDTHRILPITARHVVLNMLWYDELVRVRDVALWVRERKSEGGDKGERRCVSSPPRAGPLRARVHMRGL